MVQHTLPALGPRRSGDALANATAHSAGRVSSELAPRPEVISAWTSATESGSRSAHASRRARSIARYESTFAASSRRHRQEEEEEDIGVEEQEELKSKSGSPLPGRDTRCHIAAACGPAIHDGIRSRPVSRGEDRRPSR